MKWQSGDFGATQQLTVDFPNQLLMLCKLVNITPAQLLADFVDNLSCGTWKRQGRDRAKSFLIEYFIEHDYGSKAYSVEQIRTMFKELDAISLLCPNDADPEVLDSYAQWREKYQVYWFKKWSAKPQHLLP